jgi:replicative DNA helicase
MAPTQLHVLAARPGQGKTAFAVDLALKVAKKCKAFNDSIEPGEKPKCVLFISCEMNAQEIINRMISNLSLTSYSKYGDQIRRIAGDQNALLAVRNAQALIASLPLDIDDSSKDIESIAGAVREKSFAKDIQLVVIDYIQRIGSTNARKNSNTHEIITKTVMELKNIAKKRNTVVFALAAGGRSLDSLTRTTTAASGNKGKSSEPELGDIRDSSSIEFEADTVSYLYEDTGGKDGDNATKNDAVAIVKYCMKKNRNGTAGDTRLRFEKPFSRFTTGGSALRFSPSND